MSPAERTQGETITRNAARCKKCGDVIESKSVHDFVSCKCGAIFVDGGRDYIRRGGDLDAIEDLSEEKRTQGETCMCVRGRNRMLIHECQPCAAKRLGYAEPPAPSRETERCAEGAGTVSIRSALEQLIDALEQLIDANSALRATNASLLAALREIAEEHASGCDYMEYGKPCNCAKRIAADALRKAEA